MISLSLRCRSSMLQICDTDGAHWDKYSAIIARNVRPHTLMVLCLGIFSSSDFRWLRR